ncbi:CheR family methyltransferase [Oligoflexus tunisiensis]|uniref:CheR family methyltransferase n=1 Tax=Oligoflexus tunisiensis TaxID=708132 RepID=UPI000AD24716|nr:protein-glutamate O-methyltransferase CheR [Oligoflexus tunisiensis]
MRFDLALDPKDLQGLVDSIHQLHGYDFRGYTPHSLQRRFQFVMRRWGIPTFATLRDRILHETGFFHEILGHLTVTTSEMFRDPDFYRALVQEVLPRLATYPSPKIWHAGCSSGEEVYSLAILLREANLLQNTIIYATDINPTALGKARAGVYPTATIQKATENYRLIHPDGDFARHYVANYGMAAIDRRLRDHIVFAEHNLVTDSVFSETQLVLCRNVLIYFDVALRERVLKLFDESLCHRGFLAIGMKESLQFSLLGPAYVEVVAQSRIYQKRISCSQQKY